MTTVIYTLRLKDDKYYVGKSIDLERRVGQHFLGNGAAWTKLFKPVDLYHCVDEKGPHHENFQTIIMMKMYGIQNVRGGEWCLIDEKELNKELINNYLSMIDETKDYDENYSIYSMLVNCNDSKVNKNNITNKQPVINSNTNILNSNQTKTLEYIINKLNIYDINIDSFEKDSELWQKFLLFGRCAKCKERKDVKYMKPFCHDCWRTLKYSH